MSTALPMTPAARPPSPSVAHARALGRHSGATVRQAASAISSVPTAWATDDQKTCASKLPECVPSRSNRICGPAESSVYVAATAASARRIGASGCEPAHEQRGQGDQHRRDAQSREIRIDAVRVAERDRHEQRRAEAELRDDERRGASATMGRCEGAGSRRAGASVAGRCIGRDAGRSEAGRIRSASPRAPTGRVGSRSPAGKRKPNPSLARRGMRWMCTCATS